MARKRRVTKKFLTKKEVDRDELESEFQARVLTLARYNGWKVYSVPDSRRATMSGWPDLTMYRVSDKRLVFAELKRAKGGRVSDAQEVVLAELAEIGEEVYLWKPEDWDEIARVLGRD